MYQLGITCMCICSNMTMYLMVIAMKVACAKVHVGEWVRIIDAFHASHDTSVGQNKLLLPLKVCIDHIYERM